MKVQFLKELQENTFSGSDNEDVNEHIEKVLEIVDLFHVLNITEDQLMLRVFPISLTGAEVILFYNGLDVPTRQILDSKGVVPTKTAADAKKAIQEMAEYSQKWHNGTFRGRSSETSDGLAAIQAQLNNLGREIKKLESNTAQPQVFVYTPSNNITTRRRFEGYNNKRVGLSKDLIFPTTPKVVERETEVTKDTVPPTNNGSTKDVQPPVVQFNLKYQILSPMELTLRGGKISSNIQSSFKLRDTPLSYYDMTENRSTSFEMAFEEVFLRILESLIAFLALEYDATSPEVDDSYSNLEGDILLLESFLNDDPSLPPPTQGNYLPEIRKELKVYEAKTDKSSIDMNLPKSNSRTYLLISILTFLRR
ncbi:hypothetical protein Tco_1200926 [Tanacetum coccineum]